MTNKHGAGITGVMLIYKILRQNEWQALQDAGETNGAPIDVADGYIHFSTAEQVIETASKHFAGVDGLMLLAYDTDAFGDALKWEVSRGGAQFPHLYAKLPLAEIIWVRDLPLINGVHKFPESLT